MHSLPERSPATQLLQPAASGVPPAGGMPLEPAAQQVVAGISWAARFDGKRGSVPLLDSDLSQRK